MKHNHHLTPAPQPHFRPFVHMPVRLTLGKRRTWKAEDGSVYEYTGRLDYRGGFTNSKNVYQMEMPDGELQWLEHKTIDDLVRDMEEITLNP